MEESGRFTAWKQPGTNWLSQTVILGIIVEKKGGMQRHCATSRKVAGSIPDGAPEFLHRHDPSGCTMALGSTQPLTEINTGNISWG
jgi:hypothetical protein